jgi:invasion protein IalB
MRHFPKQPPYSKRIKADRQWGWIRTFVAELSNGTEERVIQVRLPSYGMGYCINIDEERWGQRVFVYCGQRGCYMNWYFKPETAQAGSEHG